MHNKKILFRVDGNSTIGLGHVYRLIALYDMLSSSFSCTFLSRDTEAVKNALSSNEKITSIPDNIHINDEPIWINDHFSATEHIIITDGYYFDSDYQKQIKSFGFNLICVDDLAEIHMHADLVINHSLAIQEKDYSAESYTQFALGTQYALLRKSFLEVDLNPRKIENLNTAFVCFGGADPNDFTIKATKALLKLDKIKRINVVIGNAYPHQSIHQIEDSRLFVHKNLNEESMRNTMLASDVAVAPASTICYELCSVRVLLYSGYYVENQKLFYNGLVDNGLIIDCGDFNNFNFDNIDLEVKEENITALIHRQKDLFDGKTKDRFNNKIEAYV